MAITYEWTFTPEVADEGGKTDVVKIVHWRLTASESGTRATIFGAAAMKPPGSPFVAFGDLTEERVKGWVLDALGQTDDAMKARAAAQLDAIKNPALVQKGFPW